MGFNENLLFDERRMEVRYSLNGLIPMTFHDENRMELSCVFIDVSSNGLGIIVEPKLRVDETVYVKFITGLELELGVRWVKKPIGVSAKHVPIFHRAGLSLDSQKNQSQLSLVETLEQFQCVDH